MTKNAGQKLHRWSDTGPLDTIGKVPCRVRSCERDGCGAKRVVTVSSKRTVGFIDPEKGWTLKALPCRNTERRAG